jgi:hypothetical protein
MHACLFRALDAGVIDAAPQQGLCDANILIDLEDAELTALLFRLPFRVMAPDLLFFDELAAENPHLM